MSKKQQQQMEEYVPFESLVSNKPTPTKPINPMSSLENFKRSLDNHSFKKNHYDFSGKIMSPEKNYFMQQKSEEKQLAKELGDIYLTQHNSKKRGNLGTTTNFTPLKQKSIVQHRKLLQEEQLATELERLTKELGDIKLDVKRISTKRGSGEKTNTMDKSGETPKTKRKGGYNKTRRKNPINKRKRTSRRR
jgi:hypothetical protein